MAIDRLEEVGRRLSHLPVQKESLAIVYPPKSLPTFLGLGSPSRPKGAGCGSAQRACRQYHQLFMRPKDFDCLVERAFKKVPRRFRQRLTNVVLVVEQEPPQPNLLGLYQGRPLTHRSVSDGFVLPDKITIYQGPHERAARTPFQLEKLVEETVWHEIAHYFGLDEREVRRAEIRRRRPR